MTDYQTTLDWLFRQLPMFSRVGAAAYKPGLDTSLRLDEYFGHPHRRFKSIHVAGTNGKGSCSHLIASVLQAQGYKVGLYTSPHLTDFRERIRVDGKMIPPEAVIDFVDCFRNSGYEGHPSFFELTMMLAFSWFAGQEVDYAVIEVGMGGRLDSTNIITPIASLITNISFDHTQFLGDTLPAIASEKAGIMKPGIPVVVGEAEGDVRKVFEEKAAEVGAPVRFVSDCSYLLSKIEDTPEGFLCETPLAGRFVCPLAGDYQKKNIPTVLRVIEMLRDLGVDISDESVVKGFESVVEATGLRGRWTVLSRNPFTVCDTGHNQAGLTYNMAKLSLLRAERGSGKLRMVVGFVADKDVDHILQLFPKDATYYITKADIPRALPEDELARKMNACGLKGETFPYVIDAYRRALADSEAENAGSEANEDIIYIGGSTFVVADLLRDLGL